MAALPRATIRAICTEVMEQRIGNLQTTRTAIARRHGVSPMTVTNIASGKYYAGSTRDIREFYKGLTCNTLLAGWTDSQIELFVRMQCQRDRKAAAEWGLPDDEVRTDSFGRKRRLTHRQVRMIRCLYTEGYSREVIASWAGAGYEDVKSVINRDAYMDVRGFLDSEMEHCGVRLGYTSRTREARPLAETLNP